MDKIKALIIDDKKIIGDLFSTLLGGDQHDIRVVQDPDEALEIIKNEDFDIAFLDIMMPQRDGLETLKEMKAISPDLPIIMMSGYEAGENRDKVRELGAVACLEKPVEMEDVRKAVKLAIGKDI